MPDPTTPAAFPVASDSTVPGRQVKRAAGELVPAAHAGAGLRWMSALHERQRQDVAAALHNHVGQAISAITLSAHLLLDETDALQRREDVLDIIRIADAAVAQIRDLHCQLRPPQLDSLGLEAALRGEVDRLVGAVTEVRVDLAALPTRPAPAVELACLRIAQQLLTHALAPADAAPRSPRLHLALRDDGGMLSLRVRVEAVDHQDVAAIAAWELESLCEYAAALGGTLRAETAGGSCLVVEVRLPFTVETSLPTDRESGHDCNRGSPHA